MRKGLGVAEVEKSEKMEKKEKEEIKGSEEMEKEVKEEIEGSEVMERGCKRCVCKKGRSKTCLLKQPFVTFVLGLCYIPVIPVLLFQKVRILFLYRRLT